MKNILSILCLVALTGCIGVGAKTAYTDSRGAIGADYIGQSRDDLILRFGPASRTATLDDGRKLMQYNCVHSMIERDSRRRKERCDMRFWLRDGRVVNVDNRGYGDVCAEFIRTGIKDQETDFRR
jgi:hypothetical protein